MDVVIGFIVLGFILGVGLELAATLADIGEG